MSFKRELKKYSLEDVIKTLNYYSRELYNDMADDHSDNDFKKGIIKELKFDKYGMYKVWLKMFDLHKVAYFATHYAKGNELLNNSLFANIINLYNRMDDSEAAHFFQTKITKDDGLYKWLLGYIQDQKSCCKNKKEVFNRELTIMFETDTGKNFKHNYENIIYEKFGITVETYFINIIMLIMTTIKYENPLRYVIDYPVIKDNFPETKLILEYFSLSPKEIWNSKLEYNIFFSKPFIKINDKYITPSVQISLTTFASSLYWIVRDYYCKIGSHDFTNSFGYMFEDYVYKISQNFLNNGNVKKITLEDKASKNNKKPDFEVDFDDIKMVIECKSSLLNIDVRSIAPNFASVDKYILNVINEAYEQIDTYCKKIPSQKIVIKVVLLYENIFSSYSLKNTKDFKGKNDVFHIMTISDFEAILCIWKKDKCKCKALLNIMAVCDFMKPDFYSIEQLISTLGLHYDYADLNLTDYNIKYFDLLKELF